MMSYTFSRREFFKYSAAAAVAVAGVGLLGGCSTSDPNNLYSTEIGTTLGVLQVAAALKKEGTDIEKGVFALKIQNSRGIPLVLAPEQFSVKVLTTEEKTDEKTNKTTEETVGKYYSLKYGGVQITGMTDSVVDKGEIVELTITAPNFPKVERDETVVLKYCPITTSQYAGYSMSWGITKEADDYTDITQPDGSSSSNT